MAGGAAPAASASTADGSLADDGASALLPPSVTPATLDQAEAAFRRAIELDPGHAGPHASLGLLLEARGSVEAAIDSYQSAAAALVAAAGAAATATVGRAGPASSSSGSGGSDSDGALGHGVGFSAGELHAKLGLLLQTVRRDNAGATAAYRRAVALCPDDADAHYNLGALLEQVSKDFDGAEQAFRRFVEIAPQEAVGHERLKSLLAVKAKAAAGDAFNMRFGAAFTKFPAFKFGE